MAKLALDTISKGLRMYLEIDKPEGKRHRYTTMRLEGDRCKPTEIETHYRAKNKRHE